MGALAAADHVAFQELSRDDSRRASPCRTRTSSALDMIRQRNAAPRDEEAKPNNVSNLRAHRADGAGDTGVALLSRCRCED